MTILYELVQSQNAQRVRLEVAGTEPVEVLVGNPNEPWTDGCYIEVVRVSATATVSFQPYDGSVTLNVLGASNQLRDGEYGRVSLVAPGVWDLHIYQRAPVVLSDIGDVNTGAVNGSALVYDGGTWQPMLQPWIPKDAPVKPAPFYTFTTGLTTLILGSAIDHAIHVRCTAATDVTVEIPPSSDWTGTQEYWEENFNPSNPGPMPIGGTMVLGKHSTGNVIFVPGPGVVINTPDSLMISNLHGKATLMKVGVDEWDLEGNIGT